MDTLDQLRIFRRVAELGSFTRAAEELGLPKASVSIAVQQLEARLGTRLLHRTTRRVEPSQDGRVLQERARDLLDDIEDLHTLFRGEGASLTGRLRVDLPTGMTAHVVMPRLAEFLAAHPRLEIEFSSTDRRVDLVREGFDCVLRVGALVDASLVARRLGELEVLNCASPAYLARHGTPQTPADLATHRLVHYVPHFGAPREGFEYHDGTRWISLDLAGALVVNNADAYQAACLAGFGLIQAPATGLHALLRSGALVQVLPRHRAQPMPVHLLYAHRRHLPRRVRAFMQWLTDVVREAIDQPLPE